jgi:dihydroorotase
MADKRRAPVDLIVRNGTVVTPTGTYHADLAIADETFVAIAVPGALDLWTARDTCDAAGLHVLPGIIDAHVHFRDPGLEYKEDFSSGSRAAVMGGVTTVIDMPNTRPPTSTADRVLSKRRIAERRSYCDFGLFGLLGHDNLDDLLPMARAGIAGYKCFLAETTGTLQPPDDGVLLEALQRIRPTGLRVGFHAENNEIIQHRSASLQAQGRTDPLAHFQARPTVAEVEAIQRAALFAHQVGTPIHIFHLTSRQGLEMVERWRARGVDITCETAPQYCYLTAEAMPELGGLLKINPPVREAGHGEALQHGLAEGRINAIATDHAPHTLAEKTAADIWQTLSGFAGVETSVRLFLTYAVGAGAMSLQQYVRAASEGPARMWGLYPRKGAIRVGSDADLTIVDLQREGIIAAASLHGKNNHGPWEGHRTRGEAVATVVRGKFVMRNGELLDPPRGRMVAHAGSIPRFPMPSHPTEGGGLGK